MIDSSCSTTEVKRLVLPQKESLKFEGMEVEAGRQMAVF